MKIFEISLNPYIYNLSSDKVFKLFIIESSLNC